MKIILSRKGFDSSAGGCPNPIFEDGSMLALPIPDGQSKIFYKDISFTDSRGDSVSLGPLVKHFTKDKVKPHHKAHLDPDLMIQSYARSHDWQPVLGQSGSAQGHLANHKIGVGDVFVYFAVFKEVEKFQRKWRFVPKAKSKHVIWAMMQVADVLKVDDIRDNKAYRWLAYHPHWQYGEDANNTFYIGDPKSTHVFPHYHESLQLTKLDSPKPTQWALPNWWYPKDLSSGKQNKEPLSYHHKLDRWQLNNDVCELQAVARGQEFILDTKDYSQAQLWLKQLAQLAH